MAERNVLFVHWFEPTGNVVQWGDGKHYEKCGFELSNGSKCGWPRDEHPATDAELADVQKNGHIPI